MSDLPLRPPEEQRPERKPRRMVALCPHCKNPVGGLVIVRGRVYLQVVTMFDGQPAGLMIDHVDGAVCVACGGAYNYHSSDNVRKILEQQGFDPWEIQQVIAKGTIDG
ncbi:hypothetical protein KQH61_06060 [bacterium]|nr:hypothetical protein [bacterium]